MLCKKIKSDVPSFDTVAKEHSWVEQIAANCKLRCPPDRDKNEGESLFAMFGDYIGGALCVQEGYDVRTSSEKGVWHTFNGRNIHWTEPFEGDCWSIVAYTKPKPKNGESTGA